MEPKPELPKPEVRKRGVVAVVVDGERLLMIQRSLTVLAPGKYCFPGGTIEPGESHAAALQRELMEELSLKARPVGELWRCVTDWGTELAWWLAECESLESLSPEPAEVAWCGWMTIEEILAHPELLPSNRKFFEAYFAGDFCLPIRG